MLLWISCHLLDPCFITFWTFYLHFSILLSTLTFLLTSSFFFFALEFHGTRETVEDLHILTSFGTFIYLTTLFDDRVSNHRTINARLRCENLIQINLCWISFLFGWTFPAFRFLGEKIGITSTVRLFCSPSFWIFLSCDSSFNPRI
jgi:hypothetical protein